MVEKSALARCTAELLGTVVLSAAVCINCTVWSFASAITAMVYALHKSSGAHFNPAVSFAVALSGKMAWGECAMYVCIQCIGATCSCLMCFYVVQVPPQYASGEKWWNWGIFEMTYTFVLAFVVLNTTASTCLSGNNQFYGIAIGCVIVAAQSAIGSLSNAFLNPAIALSYELAQRSFADTEDIPGLSHFVGYSGILVVFQLLGSILAAIAFSLVRPKEFWTLARPGLLCKAVCEALGTFVLVVTVCCCSLTQEGVWSTGKGPAPIASSLMCMTFAVGDVSGAHFNPAVTLAVLFSRRRGIGPIEAGVYMGTQLIAGLAGTATVRYAMMPQVHAFSDPLQPVAALGEKLGPGLAAEFFFTMVLAFVVLSVTTEKHALSEYFGFAIGICILIRGHAAGPISGGGLNPAIAFGSLVFGFGPRAWVASGIACSMVGGAVAAVLFRVTQPSEFAQADDEMYFYDSSADMYPAVGAYGNWPPRTSSESIDDVEMVPRRPQSNADMSSAVGAYGNWPPRTSNQSIDDVEMASR